MKGFLYGLALQWRLDIRSKGMLITCYMLPLLFFAIMGGIFTSINPVAYETLIQSMTIFGISMGALVGLPVTLVETFSSEIKKVYVANGVPLYQGVVTHFLSALLHLTIMSLIICFIAPLAFGAILPDNLLYCTLSLIVFIATASSIGCVLGLVMKNVSKLTMVSQLVFLPSIMLSGIMFPVEMLPESIQVVGKIVPAAWAYKAMTSSTVDYTLWVPMLGMFVVAVVISAIVLQKVKEQ